MATIFNFAEVETSRGNIDASNKKLQEAYETLERVKGDAAKGWEGDAREAFMNDMNTGLGYLTSMIELLNNYHTVLNKIKENYNQTEAANLNLFNN